MNTRTLAPTVSSYNFMRYLCAALTKTQNVIIDLPQIVERIYDFRQASPELRYLFEDIEFRASVNSVVSYDINESINNMQTFGIVGKLNPTYEKIVIYLTERDADEILQSCNPEISAAMIQLAHSFEG